MMVNRKMRVQREKRRGKKRKRNGDSRSGWRREERKEWK